MIYVADRETGTFIESVNSIKEALNLISEYESEDKESGVYTEDFYDIVNENHCTIY